MNMLFKQLAGTINRRLLVIVNFLRRIPKLWLHAAVFVTILLIGVLYWANFLWPKTLQFSYAHQNCFFQPVLLPQLFKAEKNDTYTASLQPTISVGGYPLLSTETCITPNQAPKINTAQTVTIAPFGNVYFKKQITIKSGEPPTVASFAADRPISTKEPLSFKLTDADVVFNYRLVVGDKQVDCAKNQSEISCDTPALGLAQSSKYDISLKRIFNNTPVEIALTHTITTVEMLHVIDSTIKDGEKIFGKPTEMIITLNKLVKSAEGIRLQHLGGEAIPIKQRIEGKQIVLTFEKDLPRSADIELVFENAEAQDKAYLPSPYKMRFVTSGGPRVIAINLGRTRVSPSGSFTLSFDSALSANQALQNFIKVDAPGASASITLRDTNVIVSYRGIPRCSEFSIKVLDGLQNVAGISGGSNWQFNARTICQEVFSIGSSVQGRSITAYRFGNGPKRIIFVGTLHGNEKSASASLHSLVGDLETNAQNIPGGNTIIVIPTVNPDGYAANSRTNANNVDLNRNFPANNWKSGVTMPGGAYLEHGGGTSPLSEPESRALANFIAGQGPRIVLSYHSIGPLLAANEAGDSLSIAQLYGRKVGWPVYGNDGANNFDYDTTGAFEDWMRDKQGIPGILIELATRGGNEFGSQKAAMWSVVQLP